MVALPAGLRPGQKGNGWALRLADVHFTRPSFLATAQTVLAQQPTPILPDPKLTPGDTFDVTAEDVCVPGYAKKVRAVGHLKSDLRFLVRSTLVSGHRSRVGVRLRQSR